MTTKRFSTHRGGYVRVPRRSRSSDDDSHDKIPLIRSNSDERYNMDENDTLVGRQHRRRPYGQSRLSFWCKNLRDSCCKCCVNGCCKKKEYQPRTVPLGLEPHSNVRYPRNVICNQKYSIITFIPKVLYEQFRLFLNLYFLIMALSQFFPEIRIGFLYTYWGPLGFVLCVTMCREAIDDFRRYRRDKEANSQKYKTFSASGIQQVPSSSIKVGDLVIVEKDQRVPADMVFLRTTEKTGSCFIRTDQLDGETDWKLRLAVLDTQNLSSNSDLLDIKANVFAEAPQKDIHSFVGTYNRSGEETIIEESLSIENTLWANTVIASGKAMGIVIYTGCESRSVMNTSQPHSKRGLLDLEVNTLTKVLFSAVVVLSIVMMLLKGWGGPWYRYLFRFILLFSYIIPISLRVNLDMGKVWYSWIITRDKNIQGTVVRSTTIPEELGRISYLLTDKTGTLTQNEMVFKKLHLGTVAFTPETVDEVTAHLKTVFPEPQSATMPFRIGTPVRRTVVTKVLDAVQALALCHNVTPVLEDAIPEEISMQVEAGIQLNSQTVVYQASSPDEVALVTWTESVGLTLIKRDLNTMQLRAPNGTTMSFTILHTFPFTSESKRMGIILKDDQTGEVIFYLKGADVVMQTIVQYNDWLEEECGNLAREGLRTLVVAKKILTEDQYQEFQSRYHQAKMSIQDRNIKVQAVVESLERDMELLCMTGVEDRLQDGVRPTLEMLRNAGIKIWMLTGDKLETATCIAKSAKLVARNQDIYTFKKVTCRTEAHLELNNLRKKQDNALVITGDSLQVCLEYYEHEFVELACQCPCVVVCRCSPTQKADIVNLLKVHSGKRTCAIGDGGNDVSMIQAADAGIGIVGKEGKQASMAADFSINQFSYIGRLLMVHGRDSYKRSASLGQFVIHRGLIISTMQAVFCSVFYFASVSLFPGFLMVGYSTVYTQCPVFSLVLDKDVSPETALMYPELYKDLTKGRSLSFKSFFMWVLISIYQGGIIMYGAFFLFEDDFIHVVSITFTSLILTELLMVALTIRTWHWAMILAEISSLVIYFTSLIVLQNYFDPQFLITLGFFWKVLVITSVSCIPLYIVKFLRKKFSPPVYAKLT